MREVEITSIRRNPKQKSVLIVQLPLYLSIPLYCQSQKSRSQSQLILNTRQEGTEASNFSHSDAHLQYGQFRVATWLILMSLDCEETRAPTVSPCIHWENTHTVRSPWFTQGSNWGPSCCELTVLTNSPLPYPDLLHFSQSHLLLGHMKPSCREN